ncbi:MAG: protein phosphatase CheZ [Azoarcus sp.]|nr:protein phosphatase CheZ [Azoarcus sp.]
MVKRKIDETEDTDELQSLFDNIAASGEPEEAAPAEAAPAPPTPASARKTDPGANDGDDNDELQSLFDSEAHKYTHIPPTANGVADAEETGDRDAVMFNRIGKMTRKLHDMLIELGLDNKLQAAANSMPDARQRLTYVVQMTEQAASKVLNASDIAKPLIMKIHAESEALRTRWGKLFDNRLSVEEFKELSVDTRTFIGSTAENSQTIDAQLLEIILAQDFQDLTGQVIKKVLEMAQALESQLLGLLIEAAPEEMRADSGSLLNGPVIDAEGRDDVVTSQGQVDDLLASLGF